MSVFTKKPLIKQQTVFDGEEKAKSNKMSFSAKRVSFDSTIIQSDSDEENSLRRSNRKPSKKLNSDDDDLLNMFRSEQSDSEDDILRAQSEVKSKGVGKPNPVPRHLKSAARSVYQPADALGQTNTNPKVVPRPRPRKMSEDIQSEEGSPRSSKPVVTTRKRQPNSATDHEPHIHAIRRSTKPRHDLSDDSTSDNDDIAVDSRMINDNLSNTKNESEMRGSYVKGSGKLKKESSKEDDYIDKDNVHSYSILKTPNKGSYSQQELDKGKGERIKLKSFENESVDKEHTDLKKEYREMVPAPRPRKHIQDAIHDSENVEIDKDVRKNLNKVPVPKARKEHFVELQEKEVISKSMLSKSRLQHLDLDGDDDDDSDEETHEKMVGKWRQIPNRGKNGFLEDEVDGRCKKEKTLDWSSLDESDDDEAVGKKVNLFKKQSPSSAKAMDDNNNKEIGKVPKPSPRPKPRKERVNVQQQRQNDTLKNTLHKDLTWSDYDSFQSVPREQGDRGQRIATPQRPTSSKTQNSAGLGREKRKKEDMTNMFEEHIPDTNQVHGDHNQFQHRKGQLRPRSSMTPKKGPMKADQGIETMTRSPHLRQTFRHTDNQDWEYLSQPTLEKQKSASLTNLYRIGDSDNDYDGDGPRRNSLDTETIRQTVYDNWLSRKNVTIKKELSKKALEKQKEQEKRIEEEERKRSAQLAFQSWNQRKTETLKEQHAKVKTKQKQEQEKIDLEKQMKEKDSKKYFESWKSQKDVLIKETHKEKKKEDNMKKRKEKEENIEKTISSKKSFENWKSKKDTILKQQLKEKKKKEKAVETKREEESYEKTIKNADEFQKWAEKKGKPRKAPPPPTLTQRAWVPGSRNISDCIPAAVQPVILHASTNRARTMSGTYRGKTKYYDF